MPKRTVFLVVITVLLTALFQTGTVNKVNALDSGGAVNINQDWKFDAIDIGMDAAIVGSKEFAPGAKSQVQISIQNNNKVEKIETPAVQSGVSQLYGSAVSLSAYLEQGSAPVVVKTDKMLLGTLRAGEVTPPIPFAIEVDEDAKPGIYHVTILLQYRMLTETTEQDMTKAKLEWEDKTEKKDLEIDIKEESMEFQIISKDLSFEQGKRSDIQIEFKNAGHEIAYDAEAEISADSPISVIQNRSFLGTVNAYNTAIGTFGIKSTGDAIPKDYVLDAAVKYTDKSGNEYITKKIKIPINLHKSFELSDLVSDNIVGVIVGIVAMGVIWVATDQIVSRKSRKRNE